MGTLFSKRSSSDVSNVSNSNSDKDSIQSLVSTRVPSPIQDSLWLKYCGTLKHGYCHICDKIITKSNWTCVFVIPLSSRGSTTVENLRVCCSNCHKNIGNTNMNVYMRNNRNLRGIGPSSLR
jgi:5-methylcytosine-specific restriction endonuclease McrA